MTTWPIASISTDWKARSSSFAISTSLSLFVFLVNYVSQQSGLVAPGLFSQSLVTASLLPAPLFAPTALLLLLPSWSCCRLGFGWVIYATSFLEFVSFWSCTACCMEVCHPALYSSQVDPDPPGGGVFVSKSQQLVLLAEKHDVIDTRGDTHNHGQHGP